MAISGNAIRALAATAAAALFSAGSAQAAPYVADITVTYDGEVVGEGGFTFDTEEATTVSGYFGPQGSDYREFTVYGMVEDFVLPLRTRLGATINAYPVITTWMGTEPDGSTANSLLPGSWEYGQSFGGPTFYLWNNNDGYYYPGYDGLPRGQLSIGSMNGDVGLYGVGAVWAGVDAASANLADHEFSITISEAVPIPAAGLLFLSGLGGLAGVHRVRRKEARS